MQKLYITIACLLALVAANPLHLAKQIDVKSEDIHTALTSYNSAALYFSKTSNVEVDLSIAFNEDVTILKQNPPFADGVACIPENNCVPTEGIPANSSIYNVTYTYTTANAFLRPSKDEFKAPDADNSSPLKVRLVQDSKHWELNNWGVLGLSPNGDFANYVRSLYEENFSIAQSFTSTDNNAAVPKFTTKVAFNPTYKNEDVLVTIDQEKTAKYWTADIDFELTEPKTLEEGEAHTCITNYGNNIIYVKDPEYMCNVVRGDICKGKAQKECIEGVAKLSDAPKLLFHVAGKTLETTHDTYLYFDSEKVVQCRFGYFEELKKYTNCDDKAIQAVGKGFFKVFAPLLEFGKDGTSRIKLFTAANAPVGSRGLGKIAIILLIVALLIIAAIIAYVLYNRKKQQDAYKQEDVHYVPV